ncbi:hypothetical protein ACFSSF_13055 [Dietzia aerolata]|uniref:hypothetical protein n=1 Tax=Dietzia aerolata TaxID=595984 RepID=UPI0036277054
MKSRRGPLLAASAAVVSFLAAGCMATAAPSESVPVDRERQQYSADGTAWGGVETIPWDTTTIPVPGGSPNSTSFHLRVPGDTAVDGEVYVGNWSIDRGSAWFRVDVNGAQGATRTLPVVQALGPGVLMSEFSLPAGESVMLTLNVGVPFSEVEQSARITPDWGITLQERPGSGGGSGSAGSSGSSGSSGSLGSGSIGSSGGAGRRGPRARVARRVRALVSARSAAPPWASGRRPHILPRIPRGS